MHFLLIVAIGVAVFSALSLLSSLSSLQGTRATGRRLLEVTLQARRQEPAQSGRFTQALGDQVHRLRVRFGFSETATLRERVTRAGYRGDLAVDLYLAARVLGPIALLVIGSTIDSNRGFWMISMPAVAYLAPDILLQQLVRRRREKIRTGLPDAIDLLVICVDAGLGLDQALLRVGQELAVSHPEVTEELMQINREQRAGKPRVDAWQDMEKRVGLPDLRSFVNMLMQTERFGTPIARALSSFADGLRLRRRQAAEEMAAKTTVKIIFPLVLFIFPSLFIVLLGPAGLTIARGLSSLGH